MQVLLKIANIVTWEVGVSKYAHMPLDTCVVFLLVQILTMRLMFPGIGFI